MKKEVWKDIPGYDGIYQASELGNIRSLRFRKIRILKPGITNKGYYIVKLFKNGKPKGFGVHALVAMSFLEHAPDRYNKIIDHIDSNPANNCIENLRVITSRENCSKERTIRSGLPVGVSLSPSGKKYLANIRSGKDRVYLGSYLSQKEAAQAYQTALKKINDGI